VSSRQPLLARLLQLISSAVKHKGFEKSLIRQPSSLGKGAWPCNLPQ